MPGRCEYIMSSCRPAPYREPRKPPSTPHPAWRFATMHLKPYPKFQKKELKLEPSPENARSLHACQQGGLRTERPAIQPCPPAAVPSKGTASRQLLGLISTNTLCKGSSPSPKAGGESPGSPWGRKGNALPGSLLMLSSSVSEHEGSLTLYQGDSGDGQLDIWAVIKPGNTKEKIAIFAAQQCGHPGGLGGSAPPGDGGGHEAPVSPRTVSMKIKGCWEVEGSAGGEEEAHCRALQQEQEQEEEEEEEESEEEGKTLSVVEMVAYLEQRANEQQVDCSKPFPLRGSAPKGGSAPASPPPADQLGALEAWENREEEGGESVRVLDMVAKLEWECLKQQSEREGGGGLSRNNSLRRNVGRVLLVGPGPEACSPSAFTRPEPSISVESHKGAQDCDTLPQSPAVNICGVEVGSVHGGAVPGCAHESLATPCAQQEGRREVGEGKASQTQEEEVRAGTSSRAEHREEPVPGMLFFSPLPESLQDRLSVQPSHQEQEWDAEAASDEVEVESSSSQGDRDECAGSVELIPFPLRRLVSHEFLEMRFKIQLLLEPQQYMALLPHHIMVKIFSLLPTQTLAALKCTCHYFKSIIESYGVRPADSRWVCDPRYREDPCKQCKRRYGRGDVSLCRWHHKPYCQALPYGPGYWMCCHGSHKDTPGCNVGLHDNRWVPAFHSISMPIYKKARESEEDSK
ncbi:hypothetical protein AAFF_G00412200 [Aldrovandia affinis]|uniref:F-box domain-containing protein n=1 Tax=Aldrovandia affinis TaxID=143900 RepID=A0AAD7WJV3_9TELE|nr:hypothetical protein AAFF_G00412200 [Aldrovandia affinis]